MNKILLIFQLLFPLIICAQCEDKTYTLCTQADVDSFFVNNGNCEKLKILEIGFSSQQCIEITDLSPLNGIKEIEVIDLRPSLGLTSLDGMESLINVDRILNLSYNLQDYSALGNLESVGQIEHRYSNSLFSTGLNDLTPYEDIKEIKRGLKITENVILKGFSSKLKEISELNDSFLLHLVNVRPKNDFTNLIDPELRYFPRLIINDCDSISLLGFEKVEHFNSLGLSKLSNKNLRYIENAKVNELVVSDLEANDTLFYLKNIDTIQILSLFNIRPFEKLEDILPNLKHINQSVLIEGNDELISLNLLEDFELPHRKLFSINPNSDMQAIIIKDNPNLNDCNIDFICRAISEYPDSILIENNGPNCTLEEIKKYCLTSNSSNVKQSTIKVYPNPVSSNLYIKSEVDIDYFELFSIRGKLLFKGNNPTGSVNVEKLDPGIYTLRVFSNGRPYFHKIVVE